MCQVKIVQNNILKMKNFSLVRIELSIAFMKSRIGSISKEIGLISITHEILNMSHFMIYSYKILCSNFCAHFDAIIVVSVKVPCRGMAYQITTVFWFLDDTEKRRIFKNLEHLKGLSEGGKGARGQGGNCPFPLAPRNSWKSRRRHKPLMPLHLLH